MVEFIEYLFVLTILLGLIVILATMAVYVAGGGSFDDKNELLKHGAYMGCTQFQNISEVECQSQGEWLRGLNISE